MLLFHLMIPLHQTLALLLLEETAEQPATPSGSRTTFSTKAESNKVRAQMHYHKVTCIGPWKPPKGAPAPKGRLALGFEAQTGTPQADFVATFSQPQRRNLNMAFKTTLRSGFTVGAGSYFVDFAIGEPAQPLLLVADTGDDLLWTQVNP
eukprot:SM000231S07490  [mRNA]  locus=s231:144169:145100:+ [translate_table: standard]